MIKREPEPLLGGGLEGDADDVNPVEETSLEESGDDGMLIIWSVVFDI